MTSPDLAVQKLIRARIIAVPCINAIVPVENIADRNRIPDNFPAIIIGDGHTSFPVAYENYHVETFGDVHVWTREEGLTTAKHLAHAIRLALTPSPWPLEDHVCHSLAVTGVRYLRDPTGEHGHAVLSVRAILQGMEAG